MTKDVIIDQDAETLAYEDARVAAKAKLDLPEGFESRVLLR